MAAPEMYTRGQPGDQDNRGESLVSSGSSGSSSSDSAACSHILAMTTTQHVEGISIEHSCAA
jgi:hypothetical protein